MFAWYKSLGILLVYPVLLIRDVYPGSRILIFIYPGSRIQQQQQKSRGNISVADPGCLSRIPDPDFYPSRIPDLGSRIQKQQQKRGVKKKLLSYLVL